MSIFLDGSTFIVSKERINDDQIEIEPGCLDLQKRIILCQIRSCAKRFRFIDTHGFAIVSKYEFAWTQVSPNSFNVRFDFPNSTKGVFIFYRHDSLNESDYKDFKAKVDNSAVYVANHVDVPIFQFTKDCLMSPEFSFCAANFASEKLTVVETQILQFINAFSFENVNITALGLYWSGAVEFTNVFESLFETMSKKQSLRSLVLHDVREQKCVDAVADLLTVSQRLTSLCLNSNNNNNNNNSNLFSTNKLNMSLQKDKTLQSLCLINFNASSERDNPRLGAALCENDTLTKLCIWGDDFYLNKYSEICDCILNIVSKTNNLKSICLANGFYFSSDSFCEKLANAMESNISIVDFKMYEKNITHAERNAREFNATAINNFLINTSIAMFSVAKRMEITIPPYVLLEIVDWLPRRIFPSISSTRSMSIMHKVNHFCKINRILSVFKSVETVYERRN